MPLLLANTLITPWGGTTPAYPNGETEAHYISLAGQPTASNPLSCIGVRYWMTAQGNTGGRIRCALYTGSGSTWTIATQTADLTGSLSIGRVYQPFVPGYTITGGVGCYIALATDRNGAQFLGRVSEAYQNAGAGTPQYTHYNNYNTFLPTPLSGSQGQLCLWMELVTGVVP
jgi:hypothetical protein